MKPPIVLAEQGHFWIGVEVDKTERGHVVDGTQMYVEYQIPAEQTKPYPLVFIHGGGGQGTDWTATPDGRPGWSTLALQQGYAVYIVDRPGHGRAARHPAAPGAPLPTVDGLGVHFAGGRNPSHTQWPGTGLEDDPAVAVLLASASGGMPPFPAHHALMRIRGAQLLDRIGPSILITNSAGCAPGWLMADARPAQVRAVVAIEPLVPNMAWGIADGFLTYDPPVDGPDDLGLAQVPPGPPVPMERLQPEPPRRLAHLAQVPIAVVTSEASFANALDPATIAYLRQAGCSVDHVRLGELGIHGNGHLSMMEKNNEEVLGAVLNWVEDHATRD